jgi:predicted amidophosphoribosyltransferase
MILNDKSSLRGKSILLVDDVVTSGETIKAALALLRPLNPKKINVLVMAKTSLK